MKNFFVFYRGKEIQFSGRINEFTDFKGVLATLDHQEKERVLNLEKITYINSFGVRSWVKFISQIKIPPVLIKCSPVMVEQFSCIPETLANCKLQSFICEYSCLYCKQEFYHELFCDDFSQQGPWNPPQVNCPSCRKPAIFPGEENYFYFLEDVFSTKKLKTENPDDLGCEMKPIDITVEINNLTTGENIQGQAKTICQKGMFLYCRDKIVKGQNLIIQFNLPESSFKHKVNSIVHRVDQRGGGLEIKFINPHSSMQKEIQEYIQKFYS